MPSGRTQNLKVQALVFVGDAMEEKLDDLCHAAGELGVPAPDSAQEHITERGEQSRSWLAHRVAVEVRSGEQVALAFLDSVLHLAAGAVDLLIEKAGVRLGALLNEVTMKRGLASPFVHFALATTRRRRDQLSSVA